jgi:hypothetical protein
MDEEAATVVPTDLPFEVAVARIHFFSYNQLFLFFKLSITFRGYCYCKHKCSYFILFVRWLHLSTVNVVTYTRYVAFGSKQEVYSVKIKLLNIFAGIAPYPCLTTMHCHFKKKKIG